MAGHLILCKSKPHGLYKRKTCRKTTHATTVTNAAPESTKHNSARSTTRSCTFSYLITPKQYASNRHASKTKPARRIQDEQPIAQKCPTQMTP